MTIDLNALKFKFKFTDNPEMPATMILIIGQFEIRGFTIRKSIFENKEPFVAYPPANRSGGGKWIKIFWTDDKELWNSFCKLVLEKFNTEHTEYLISQSINERD
ncbi:hypothetical protein JW977_02735 [Candidatus Falkowbacteria bacterium]|nr:hypothetical protein [Candidatus Falkowbacteria bacterium]